MTAVLKLVQPSVPYKETRICKKCGDTKDLTADFHENPKSSLGRRTICKVCFNKQQRESYYPTNKRSGIKNRPDKLKRLYGVTYEQIVRVLDEQHGLCANRGCGREISLEVKGSRKNRAAIDHCHKTGKFRALLCIPCNSILGTLENNKNIVLGLMEYETKHSHKE